MRKPRLREGLSTGTTATAAAMAAMRLMLTGTVPEYIATPLPPFAQSMDCQAFAGLKPASWRRLPVHLAGHGAAPSAGQPPFDGVPAAHAAVIKDGGDDPDATQGALICASIYCLDSEIDSARGTDRFVTLAGGHGIGIVTLPGLPLAVGEAAINPVPRQQLDFALRWLYARLSAKGNCTEYAPPFGVVISAPDGEKLAEQTMNARLGILGGISILGTHGTVRPFSHEAWSASITQALNVAAALEHDTVCLCTGRRSERLLRRDNSGLPAQCFIQAADMAAFALREAAARNFKNIIWGCFFGKLIKLAQGLENTHAHAAPMALEMVADICRRRDAKTAANIAECLTAQAALELLLSAPIGASVIETLMRRAARNAAAFAGQPIKIRLFHLDGRELASI